jgi:hypothetical protein
MTMTRGHSIVLAAALVASAVALSAQPASVTDPWFRLSAKPKDFVAPKFPWNTFRIDFPKNWQVAPGVRDVLVSAVERTKGIQQGASIVLHHERLDARLTPNEIDDTLAGFEAEETARRDPAGRDFKHEVKDVGGRRFVFVTYTRPGLSGPDAVVQYTIPNGDTMFRLICIAPASALPRYQAAFAHVAASFVLGPPATR